MADPVSRQALAVALLAVRAAGDTESAPYLGDKLCDFSVAEPITTGPQFHATRFDVRRPVAPWPVGTLVEVLLDTGVVVRSTLRARWPGRSDVPGDQMAWVDGIRGSYARSRVRLAAPHWSCWTRLAGGRWRVVDEPVVGELYDWAEPASGTVGTRHTFTGAPWPGDAPVFALWEPWKPAGRGKG